MKITTILQWVKKAAIGTWQLFVFQYYKKSPPEDSEVIIFFRELFALVSPLYTISTPVSH